MVESVRVPGIGRIPESTEKLSGRVPEKGLIGVSTGKGLNRCHYRKMVESVRVSGIGRIPESTEKLLERVPEKCRIEVISRKW